MSLNVEIIFWEKKKRFGIFWKKLAPTVCTNLAQCSLTLPTVGVSAMKIPKDTSKLKKHIALMCDRLNKGGKLDLSLSSQTGEPLVQQQQQKAVTPLEPLSEMQEEEDETGIKRNRWDFHFFSQF